MLRRACARAFLLLVIPLLAGCVNPFRPASPERPTQGITVLENYSEPESVLVTITRAMAAKTDGSQTYQNALSPGFLATHAAEVVSRFSGSVTIPAQWGRSLELNNLFPSLTSLRPDAYGMSFTRDNTLPADDDNPASGQVVYHRYYAVFTKDELDAPVDTIAVGIADLTLQLDGTRWQLARWDDTFIPALGANPSENPDLQSMGARRLASLSRPTLAYRPFTPAPLAGVPASDRRRAGRREDS